MRKRSKKKTDKAQAPCERERRLERKVKRLERDNDRLRSKIDGLLERNERIKKELEPVGLMKKPYPFYDGVKTQGK